MLLWPHCHASEIPKPHTGPSRTWQNLLLPDLITEYSFLFLPVSISHLALPEDTIFPGVFLSGAVFFSLCSAVSMGQVPSMSLTAASRPFFLLPKTTQPQVSSHQMVSPPLIAVTPGSSPCMLCRCSLLSHLAACWSHPRSCKKLLKLKSHKRFCLYWPEVTCNLGIEIFRCTQDGSQVPLRLRSLSFFVSYPLL